MSSIHPKKDPRQEAQRPEREETDKRERICCSFCPRGALKTSPIEDEINEKSHLSSPQKAHENASAVGQGCREMPGVGEVTVGGFGGGGAQREQRGAPINLS